MLFHTRNFFSDNDIYEGIVNSAKKLIGFNGENIAGSIGLDITLESAIAARGSILSLDWAVRHSTDKEVLSSSVGCALIWAAEADPRLDFCCLANRATEIVT